MAMQIMISPVMNVDNFWKLNAILAMGSKMLDITVVGPDKQMRYKMF